MHPNWTWDRVEPVEPLPVSIPKTVPKKCPNCSGPADHPPGSSACKRVTLILKAKQKAMAAAETKLERDCRHAAAGLTASAVVDAHTRFFAIDCLSRAREELAKYRERQGMAGQVDDGETGCCEHPDSEHKTHVFRGGKSRWCGVPDCECSLWSR